MRGGFIMLKKYKRELRYATVVIAIILIKVILSSVILPIADNIVFSGMTIHEAMRAHSNAYWTSSLLDGKFTERLPSLSVKSVTDVTVRQEKYKVEALLYSTADSRHMPFEMLANLKPEYVSQVNESCICVVLRSEYTDTGDVYYCLFFEKHKKTTSDADFYHINGTYYFYGDMVCILPSLISCDSLADSAKYVNMATYTAFEDAFGTPYPYIPCTADKVFNSVIYNSEYSNYYNPDVLAVSEYFLLSDGIAHFSTDKGTITSVNVYESASSALPAPFCYAKKIYSEFREIYK